MIDSLQPDEVETLVGFLRKIAASLNTERVSSAKQIELSGKEILPDAWPGSCRVLFIARFTAFLTT